MRRIRISHTLWYLQKAGGPARVAEWGSWLRTLARRGGIGETRSQPRMAKLGHFLELFSREALAHLLLLKITQNAFSVCSWAWTSHAYPQYKRSCGSISVVSCLGVHCKKLTSWLFAIAILYNGPLYAHCPLLPLMRGLTNTNVNRVILVAKSAQ